MRRRGSEKRRIAAQKRAIALAAKGRRAFRPGQTAVTKTRIVAWYCTTTDAEIAAQVRESMSRVGLGW